jgi:uncharacterized protein (TIGR02246 family)
MTPETIRACVQQSVQACTNRDAAAFAALFLADGEIVLPRDRLVGRTAIAQATADYLATCDAIAIEIRRILVEGNCAVVEWSWQDRKTETGQGDRTDNAIVIDFKDGAIACWREYRS